MYKSVITLLDENYLERALNESIVLGNILLETEVPIIHNDLQSWQGTQCRNILYRASDEKKFIDAYREWNKNNINLLRKISELNKIKNLLYSYYDRYIEINADINSFVGDIIMGIKISIQSQIGVLESLVEKMNRINEVKVGMRKSKKTEIDGNKVFIVHGHNNEALSETKSLLYKLGLDPVVLREQANKGQTIIEKIDTYSNVGFGIVLYTPCDKGGLNKEDAEVKPRARQNVVFEHGYLIGKIGRERVCALVKNKVETPGDISGVVYIEMDNHQAWEYRLGKELQLAGYNVDLNKL